MEKFAEFKHQGRTVVVVSHGLEQMRTFCDEAAWLSHGELQAVGPATEIVDGYSNTEHGAEADDGGGTRFGSGEARITKIELLHPERGDTRLFKTGEPATIRLHYRADERIERPVFGASIDAVGGPFLWGHTGRDSGYVPESIEPGVGQIDIRIPAITFRPVSATLSASIQDWDSIKNIDVWQRAVTFRVGPGTPFESGGYVTLGSRFGGLEPSRPMLSTNDYVPRSDETDEDAAARAAAAGAGHAEPEPVVVPGDDA